MGVCVVVVVGTRSLLGLFPYLTPHLLSGTGATSVGFSAAVSSNNFQLGSWEVLHDVTVFSKYLRNAVCQRPVQMLEGR